MLFSHRIVVNSLYTREIYLKNFKILKRLRALPDVIYPSIDLHTYDKKEDIQDLAEVLYTEALLIQGLPIEDALSFTKKLTNLLINK